MLAIDWLSHELVLTIEQIKTEVTIPNIITGLIIYTIIHTAAKTGQESGRRTKKLFKTEMQKYIYQHVNLGHKGHPIKCEESDCQPIQILTDPQLKN